MTDFYFVRHGQTAANVAGLKQGTINSEITYLTDVGIKQAKQLQDAFDISFADRIIASPLQRTRDTAAILNEKADLPISYDRRLLEISYGKWDGQKNTQLMAEHPEVFDPVLNDVLPTYASLCDGETFAAVIERVAEFMQEWAQKYPDEKIIVVSHGFTIKAATLAAQNNHEDLMVIGEPDNTSVTKITLVKANYYVRYYNRTAIGNF